MKRLAKKRIFGLVVFCTCIAVAIWSGFGAYPWKSEFDQWIDDVPMSATIDFSVPGTTSVPFEQTCQNSHGEFIYVDIGNLSPEELSTCFAGLEGRIDINARDGGVVQSTGFSESSVAVIGDEFVLLMLPVFERGKYTANIHVESPAKNLSGQPLNLTAHYMLCGLELLPAIFCGAIAVLAFAITIVVGVCTLPWAYQFGIWWHEIEA